MSYVEIPFRRPIWGWSPLGHMKHGRPGNGMPVENGKKNVGPP